MEMISNQHYSFGELLRMYRKGKKVTQKQLAQKLGVHYNTISAWELGSYLPETRGLILEVGRSLELNEQETRQILEASLTALSPYWHLPYMRNPFFTGREEVLCILDHCLQDDQPTPLALASACVLHGLGGIGKTQVAIEYAYRHIQEYTAIFWIGSETTESIISSFQLIASILGIPHQPETDPQQIVATVQRWLNIHRQWLLIWDNVECIDLLSPFLPATREGKHLFTTRRQTLGTLGHRIELRPMIEEEGILFLLRRTGLIPPTPTLLSKEQVAQIDKCEYNAVQKLVVAMDGLPLALDQVGAYIEETPCNLADYIRLYQTRQAELLKWRGEAILDHPASVVTTWSLSFEKVEQTNAAAADLLRLCAFLHSDAIPEEIIVKGAPYLGETLGPVAVDPLQLNKALRTISAYSLLNRNTKNHTLSVHRLVQVVLRAGMDKITEYQWMERAVDVVNAICIENEKNSNWASREQCAPHVQACQLLIEQTGMNRPEARSLLQKMGGYLLERGRYDEAVLLLERLLSLTEATCEKDDLELTAVLDNLAELYMYQGKYEQAGVFFHRSLAIYEKHLGPEHLDTSSGIVSLGIFYRTLGNYDLAETFFQRALAIRERQMGPDHRNTAQCFGGLAILYREQGKYEQAEALFKRAFTILERHLGREHPLIAQSPWEIWGYSIVRNQIPLPLAKEVRIMGIDDWV